MGERVRQQIGRDGEGRGRKGRQGRGSDLFHVRSSARRGRHNISLTISVLCKKADVAWEQATKQWRLGRNTHDNGIGEWLYHDEPLHKLCHLCTFSHVQHSRNEKWVLGTSIHLSESTSRHCDCDVGAPTAPICPAQCKREIERQIERNLPKLLWRKKPKVTGKLTFEHKRHFASIRKGSECSQCPHTSLRRVGNMLHSCKSAPIAPIRNALECAR